jgi:predicted ATP-grasp superfamily ATP-dependent carboligase
VLYYQTDAFTRFVSTHRDGLAGLFDFVIARTDHVEALGDKVRFQGLAEDASLPVPASCTLATAEGAPKHVPLTFPALIKPPTRDDARWDKIERNRKVVEVTDVSHLHDIWPRLQGYGGEMVLQELVPGPETEILSYHCYARAGTVVADFTGAKLRTRPAQYGHSTALTITYDAEVVQLGRDIVGRLGLDGVAKLDFKRAPDRRLLLLEINPRFNLWHHPAAIAGVNLPALVWSDLTGGARPSISPPRPGVHWMSPWDLQAAREDGVPLRAWLTWARHCQARSMMSLDDPLPFLRLCTQRATRWVRARRWA